MASLINYMLEDLKTLTLEEVVFLIDQSYEKLDILTTEKMLLVSGMTVAAIKDDDWERVEELFEENFVIRYDQEFDYVYIHSTWDMEYNECDEVLDFNDVRDKITWMVDTYYDELKRKKENWENKI